MTTLMEGTKLRSKAKLRKCQRAYGYGHFTAVVTGDGKRHPYLNAAIPQDSTGQPIAPLHTSVCECCNNAYSELMHATTCQCSECKLEAAALDGLRVQDECGIDLGWKKPDIVERFEYLSASDLRGINKARMRD